MPSKSLPPAEIDFDIGTLTISDTGKTLSEKPPWLCEIYRRDIISFLPRTDVERWRHVSHLSNSAIEATPERRLPRRRLEEFYIDAVGSLAHYFAIGLPFSLYCIYD